MLPKYVGSLRKADKQTTIYPKVKGVLTCQGVNIRLHYFSNTCRSNEGRHMFAGCLSVIVRTLLQSLVVKVTTDLAGRILDRLFKR